MKIKCLNQNHKDSTPSLHIYEDGCFCFACGFKCEIKEVLNEEEIRAFRKTKPEKENVGETIKYIETLPKKQVRGLSLHSDNLGYYILWPDKTFYKKRIKSEKSRYIGPYGRQPPLFKLVRPGKEVLVVVEGELNCVSLDLGLGDCGISLVSPGSASSLRGHIDYYCQYKHIIVVVDKDPAGVANGLELKQSLINRKKRVSLIAVDTDFNDTLQNGGPEAVKQQFMKELGLC